MKIYVAAAGREPRVRTLVAAGMTEHEACLVGVAVGKKTPGTVDLHFVCSCRWAGDPLIRAAAEGIRHVWNVTAMTPASQRPPTVEA